MPLPSPPQPHPLLSKSLFRVLTSPLVYPSFFFFYLHITEVTLVVAMPRTCLFRADFV